jgi:hypothetical protein
MDNTFGSCGIFMQKSKGEKVIREFGNASFQKEGTFAFWKQFYLIVMHSESSGDTVSSGFKLMAGVIDSKIKARGKLPDIFSFTTDTTGYITIFKGPLALSKIYYFSPLNVFYINEGMAIENGDKKEIIFKYADNNEAVRRFSDAAGILGGMSRFSNFIMVGDLSFAMKDQKGKTLIFKVNDNCLNISIK